MTESSLLEARPVETPVQRSLIWAGPLFFGVLVLLGALNRWAGPVSVGTLLNADLLGLLFPIVLLALVALAVELTVGNAARPRWRRSVAASGGGLLGGVLLIGAWSKALDPGSFAETITAEGLDFLLPAAAIALAGLAVEIGIGSALILGLRRRWVLASSTLLLFFFLFLTGRGYWRYAHGIVDESGGCGCFGNLLERTPAEAFWQDLFLLMPALILTFVDIHRGSAPTKRVVMVGVFCLVVVGFAWLAPQLPLDDLATRLHPGVEVTEMCSGSGAARICLSSLVPELLEGEHIVVLTTLDDAAFLAAVENLNAYFLDPSGPGLQVLSAATAQQSQTFFWQYGPSFDIIETPPTLLRPLYRTLPRSFLVADGQVQETFRGLPPLSDL